MRDPEKTIGNLIDKQATAFLGSISPEGFPNIKALLKPKKREGIRTIYLATSAFAMGTAQLRKNPKACLYFSDRRFYRGVMLEGTMEILEGQEYKEMVWQEEDTAHDLQGVTDPGYCVLRFTGIRGRYYSKFKSEDFEIPEKSRDALDKEK